MIAVDFVIFKTLPDPRPIVVRQVLNRTADLDMVLWNFSRFKDDRRITLQENPHFYLDLPTSVDAYTGEFNAFPVQNIQLTSNATIYVLVDQPSSQWTCEDWRHLIHRRQGLDNNDLHIHARQRPPDFARNWSATLTANVRATGYNLLYTTADTLNIDVLLTIFNHYRLDDEERWNTQLRWCKLSHGVLSPESTPPRITRYSSFERTVIPPSTLFLVTLKLTKSKSWLLSPEDLVTQLSTFPDSRNYRSVSLCPCAAQVPRGSHLVRRPPLRRFLLSSGSYSKERHLFGGIIALISVPLLERLKITLFYEPTFQLSHLFGLIKTTEGLGKPVASVIFCDLYDRAGVSFAVGSRDELGNRSLILEIRCYLFSQQVQSVTRLCGALFPDLTITDLALSIDKENLELGWQNVVGGVAWRGLLRPFRSVQKLRIHHLLALQLSDALGSDGAGSAPGLLPMLGELESQMGGSDAFAAFIRARERAGRPVRLSSSPPLWQQLSGLLAEIRAQAPLLAGHPQAP
ncbi:hypothetical protein BC826DRAFT_1106538 [Russula brevipes]|nr:hypothetical protein BC826DRAFT_1106538 [Russula brevipes]